MTSGSADWVPRGRAVAGGAAPTLFYSRRIGLQGSVPVQVLAGGRLTGKVGPFDVGLLSIQTAEDDAIGAVSTNFSVVRVKRDVFGRSNVGALFENRSASIVAPGESNQGVGCRRCLRFQRRGEPRHLLCAVAHSASRRERPELSGPVQLRCRPHRRHSRLPRRRERVQPGDRIRAPPRFPQQRAERPVQPAARVYSVAPADTFSRRRQLFRERSGEVRREPGSQR